MNSRREMTAAGFTEELARDSALVRVSGGLTGNWLKPGAEITISVPAPFAGEYGSKTLECSASVVRIRAERGWLRAAARVHKMAFVERSAVEPGAIRGS